MKLIAVDAGHGMNTAGKRTPMFSDGTIMKENEFNRATADYLVKALNRNNINSTRYIGYAITKKSTKSK